MDRRARRRLVRGLLVTFASALALILLLWAAGGGRVGYNEWTLSGWWVAPPLGALLVWAALTTRLHAASQWRQAAELGYGPRAFILRHDREQAEREMRGGPRRP